MTEKAKKPSLRFKGYNDDWEQHTLKDLCNTFTDGDWIESKDQSTTGVRLLQTGNVGINQFINKKDRAKWISEDTFKRLKCTEVYPGDIIISRLPEPAGRACIVPNTGDKMITAVDCTIVRNTSNCVSKYLIQYLSSSDYFDEVNDFLAGGTRQRISRNNLGGFKIPLPPTVQEQENIGQYFNHIDSLITLYQHKFLKLQNLKKAMFEKMFPKNGESVPEIRFYGFNYGWKKRKVEEFAVLSQGLQIPISKRFLKPSKNRYFYITNEFLNPTYPKKYYIEKPSISVVAKKEDILMTRTGNTGIIVTDVEGVFHNNFFKIGYDKNCIDKRFLCYSLKTDRKQKEILLRAGSSTIPDLSHKSFYSLELKIPSIEEQKIIGLFFEKMDTLITLHQCKLEKLKNIKKSMLEKMLV